MNTLLPVAQVYALLVGIAAATFITFWLDTVDNPFKAICAVFFSGMLSAFGAPVAVAYVEFKWPVLDGGSQALLLLFATIIGGIVTWGLPILIQYLRNKYGGQHG
jgi:hypothetical protein